ncbi:MAG: efflux transporter outer membrane subunit [Gammaproteobacteria bacterium]
MLKASFRVCLPLMCLVSACAVAPKPFEPPIELPAAFTESGQVGLLDRWWLHFNDAELNRLIETALSQNLDLRATFERLQQAEAVARKTGAALIPDISGTSSLSRSIQQPGEGRRLSSDDFSLGLSAAYELDLWGRIRAATRAAELDTEASALDVETAGIALSAEIANTWYQWVEQMLQLELLDRQIETNSQNVDIVAARFRGGQATAADLYQQTQVLEATRGDKYSALAAFEVLKNRLAVLTGQAPGMLSIQSDRRFPILPALPKTGLTADLIKRRPDVSSAYNRLQAADLRVAAAIADRFPKISLTASIETSAPDLHDLFNNWLGTLAGNILIPLIDGGRRRAEVRRNEAVTAEAFYGYGQRILLALEEVENALVRESRQHQRLASLEKQALYLDRANSQIRMRYVYGAIDFLRVLTSQINQQSLERSVLRAERELIGYRIDLYRSLAGGWQITRPNRTKEQTDG